MPWSMIHFSIAINLYGNNVSPSFLLGSIAPDAVLVREKEKNKVKSHLFNRQTGQSENLKEFYYSKIKLSNDENYNEFMLGYIAHIFADLEWRSFKKSIIKKENDDSIKQLLWDEENQNDFNLFRVVLWKDHVMKDVLNAPLYEIADMYTLNELEQWRRQVFDWFEIPKNEPQISIKYLNKEVIEGFILNTSQQFKKIYLDS